MNQKKDSIATFPTTEKDKQKVAMLKEVGTILKDVYQNPKAFYEVCATIYSGYYEDERVLLKDLLFPQYSPIYKSEKFKELKAETGLFKQKFWEAYYKGDYPYLRKAMHLESLDRNISNLSRTENTTATGYQDTTLEIYSNSNGISIYFPYSENFAVPLTTEYFDQINTYPGYKATIVSADRESDSGPGQEPYVCSSSKTTGQYCFRAVTVNDDYAELTATHIVGVGAEQRICPANPPPATNVVFIGEVKCDKKNYDRLITFNGYLQGGGPDLRFCRGSGYLTQDGSGQITNPQNVVQANPTRKQCKHAQWIPVYGVWDADWAPDNLNQVFAIYEEDKKGTSTVNLSLQTTVRLNSTVTGVGTVGFSWSFNTEDDIIRQLAWNRQSFFQYNQGGLNNNCGTRNGWTIYDCFSHVAYTMPTQ